MLPSLFEASVCSGRATRSSLQRTLKSDGMAHRTNRVPEYPSLKVPQWSSSKCVLSLRGARFALSLQAADLPIQRATSAL